jgi:glucose-1-phosphate adenylyltransferase
MGVHENSVSVECPAAILGGGRGTRLFPLTLERAKPAVPFGGKFRLIDVPISNCLNSGINAIFVLTQFNTASLHRHIHNTYRFDHFRRGFVHILAAEQSYRPSDWYQGTADAVRQNLSRLLNTWGDNILILGGDQLYRMDFSSMIARHVKSGADVTIAALPVAASKVSEFGVLQIDGDGRVVSFAEKPQDPQLVQQLAVPDEDLRKHGVEPKGRSHLVSMGIYVFNKKSLTELLEDRSKTDFGGHIIPSAIETRRVHAFLFDGYWEDIGTIRGFFEANLALTDPLPPFNLYDARSQIYSRPRFLPAAKMAGCEVGQALVGDGSILEQTQLDTVVVGIRSIIRAGTRIRRSIIMGADYYQSPREFSGDVTFTLPLGIGEDCYIENAIIDKNSRLGGGCVISNQSGVKEAATDNYYIRDGIVVIPRDTILPPGTVI